MSAPGIMERWAARIRKPLEERIVALIEQLEQKQDLIDKLSYDAGIQAFVDSFEGVKAELVQTRAENERLKQKALTCICCKESFTDSAGLIEHLNSCRNHPVSDLRDERDTLRAQLERLSRPVTDEEASDAVAASMKMELGGTYQEAMEALITARRKP